jgi:hypothetical protein
MQVIILKLSLIYHDISGRIIGIRDVVDLIMGKRGLLTGADDKT